MSSKGSRKRKPHPSSQAGVVQHPEVENPQAARSQVRMVQSEKRSQRNVHNSVRTLLFRCGILHRDLEEHSVAKASKRGSGSSRRPYQTF